VLASHLVVLFAVGANPVGSAHTLDSAANQIVARQARLRRLFVAGYMTTTVEGHTRIDRFASALAPDRCFLDFMHETRPGTPPWRDNQRFQLWLTADRAVLFKPFSRDFHPQPSPEQRKDRQDYWRTPYGSVIGWHPEVRIFQDRLPEPFYLEDVFAPDQRSQLLLGSETEEVDSLQCLAFETKSKSEKLWLAPHLGFALVKRVMLPGRNNQFKNAFRCGKFKEVADGLWLPMEVESEKLDVSGGVEKRVRHFRIELEELAANDGVPDTPFECKPPPGTLTRDAKGNVIGFEPGGEDLMDLWGAVCAEVFPPDPPQRPPTWQFVLSAAMCVLGLVAGIVALGLAVRTGSRAGPGLASADS